MNEFKKLHPTVILSYFIAVLGFETVFLHPVTLAVSLISSLTYSIMLNGRKAVRFNLLYMLPLVLITVLITPLLNHQGMTVLSYLPSGNPLTLESVLYAIATAVMLWSVMCHFSCFNRIMTSDKLVYLFGKLFPALSLIFSMVLRFVPNFKSQLGEVRTAQSYIGQDGSCGAPLERAKSGIKILSIMITRSLESAIDTADSMKSRGYGLSHRTAYSNFRLCKRDIAALLYILSLSGYILAGGVKKLLYFNYFPYVKGLEPTAHSISVYIAYLLLFVCPIIIEVWKAVK